MTFVDHETARRFNNADPERQARALREKAKSMHERAFRESETARALRKKAGQILDRAAGHARISGDFTQKAWDLENRARSLEHRGRI